MCKINKFDGKRIEFNVIQSVAANCLNRDENNEPKISIAADGTTRQRISSQCFKRAIRMNFHTKTGIKCVSSQLLDIVEQKAITVGAPNNIAKNIAVVFNQEYGKICSQDKNGKLTNNNTLMHISENEIDAVITECAKDFNNCLDKKGTSFTFKFNDIVNNVIKESDIALFGRMIAENTNNTVQAAASFAHAYSINSIEPFTDFYTAAIDNHVTTNDQGATNMGNTSMMPPNYLYRYFNIDLSTMYKNKNGDIGEMISDIKDFISAAINSVPCAHQSGMAAMSEPEYFRIDIREDGVSNQVPFNKAINENILSKSIERITKYINKCNMRHGTQPVKTFESCIDPDIENIKDSSLTEIKTEIENYIKSI